MIRIKTAKQIAGIRKSCHLLAEVLELLETTVQPGITTGDLDEIAKREIASRGGRPAFLGYQGFPGALCTSVNEAVIHGIPGNRRLNEGDVVSIDCGIEYDGYYSDSAITVPVGTTSPDVTRLLEVTRSSLEDGIDAAQVGKRVNDVSRAIYKTISGEGYGIVRPYCGHGVGLSLHEDPQIPNYVGRGPNPRLKHGMVVAIEPMVNLGGDDVDVLEDDWTVVTGDRTVSAHFEHTVAIFREHTEVLTRRSSERVHSSVEAPAV
ncbi:MAG: type I methionyl aminopeptidase [Spirochaeta sp.]|jgi:methionyl aminopeptidase|nr:type I methionyl aminopeptidase [Spirochaeta sp.]